MSGMWMLEGVELGDSTTQIFITAYSRGRKLRVASEAIHGGGEVVESVGKDLTRLNLTFTILGQDTNKHTWVAYIMGILENLTQVRLESPSDDEDLRLLDTYRVVIFMPEGEPKATQVNRAQLDIIVPAIILGVPVSDGGTYLLTENWQEAFL